MYAGVLAYALFGGADFGSGFYDLTAGNRRRGAVLRTQVDHSIGPVGEANRVWLIYVLVAWWSDFPDAFAAAMNTVILPLLFALLGIVWRGAAIAFRKYAATLARARLFGAVFAVPSLITPFFLGAVVGAIALGSASSPAQWCWPGWSRYTTTPPPWGRPARPGALTDGALRPRRPRDRRGALDSPLRPGSPLCRPRSHWSHRRMGRRSASSTAG